MSDELDLRNLQGRYEPDPAFRLALRRQVEAIVHVDALPTPSADSTATKEDLIMLTDERTQLVEVSTPTRRWLLPAAVVAIIAGVAAVALVTNDDDGGGETTTFASPTASTPAAVTEPTTPAGPQPIEDLDGEAALEPGTYSIDPDGDPSTPLRVTYEVPAEGWESWIGAAKRSGYTHVLVSISTVTNVTKHACDDYTAANPAVGPTVDDLATALSQLAPFEVSSPPTDLSMLGYQGKNLELTVPPDMGVVGDRDNYMFADCLGGQLRSWISPTLDGSFYGYNGEPGRVEEFWILDVDGTRLMIEATYAPDSPPEDVAEMDAIVDSIRIEP